MSACERCWGDAFIRSLLHGGSQAAHYHALLVERADDTACVLGPDTTRPAGDDPREDQA